MLKTWEMHRSCVIARFARSCSDSALRCCIHLVDSQHCLVHQGPVSCTARHRYAAITGSVIQSLQCPHDAVEPCVRCRHVDGCTRCVLALSLANSDLVSRQFSALWAQPLALRLVLQIDTPPVEPLILAVVVVASHHVTKGHLLAEAVECGIFAVLTSLLFIVIVTGRCSVSVGDAVGLVTSQ